MPRLRSCWFLLAALVLSLAPLAGCVTNPRDGAFAATRFILDDEIKMGADAAPQFLDQSGGQVGDAFVLQYIADLGQRLAAQSENPELEWEFFVLDSSVINAFALPGGKVFVSRGLLEKMTNESQLAGVLGHEIGHVTARPATNA